MGEIKRVRKSGYVSRVQRGLDGLNKGLPNGIGTMNKYLYGTQKGRYYLIGGESGTGKTTITDFMFLFAPYRHLKEYMGTSNEISIKWTYFSFEQSTDTKIDSWASKYIFDTYNQRLPSAYLLGKTSKRVTKEHLKWCNEAEAYIEDMLDHVEMIDTPISPSAFKNKLIRYGSAHGTWHTQPILDSKGDPILDKNGKKNLEIIGWTPKNPETTHIFIMDHVAYAMLEKKDIKTNIDDISTTIVFFREKAKWTFAIIQQFNTELASVDRLKHSKNALAPQRVDFGDSRYTYRDADVVLGLLNPYAYDLKEYGNYDIMGMGGYAIWLFLMKNRHDGPASKSLPLFMDPVSGIFTEIPPAILPELEGLTDDEDPSIYFVEKAKEFRKTIDYYM